jgi:transcriptional regulator PpsR
VLSQLEQEAITTAVQSLADLQLQINAENFIAECEVANPELKDLSALPWQGQSWFDLLPESQHDKANEALRRARTTPGSACRVDLEHLWPGGHQSIPISYRLIASPDGSSVFALGRDLRPETNLRQQLTNAQQSMEQDYWSMRQIENRYRHLFAMANDGFLVIDDMSMRVLEANPRATQLLAGDKESIVGRAFPIGMDGETAQRVTDAMNLARASGSQDLAIVLGNPATEGQLHIAFLRQGRESRFLIKITVIGANEAADRDGCRQLFESSPDAVLIVDDRGEVMDCNRTFLEWTQSVNHEQVIGRSMEHWIGRSSVDASVLLSNVSGSGTVRLYASVLNCRGGITMDIEISAARLPSATPRLALFIRDIARRVTTQHPMSQQLPGSIEQITRRVGQVPLKELVRESTDVIEALCIQAALELTHDNRASAAELLGLSRQSLYTKLRKYNIGDGSDLGQE